MRPIDKLIMICLFLITLLYFIVDIGYSQEIVYYNTNQQQINWDQEFNKIPTDQAKWNIYTVNLDKNQTKENSTLLASAVTRPFLVQLNEEGTFFVGVSALRVINENVTIESNILWSDKAIKPFGIKNYIALPMPSNLRAEWEDCQVVFQDGDSVDWDDDSFSSQLRRLLKFMKEK